ncbi:hypothetical protein DIPPA_30637, partial [Diplonema papillatum]
RPKSKPPAPAKRKWEPEAGEACNKKARLADEQAEAQAAAAQAAAARSAEARAAEARAAEARAAEAQAAEAQAAEDTKFDIRSFRTAGAPPRHRLQDRGFSAA